ncbi:MAG: extracellular solute-binding protein [Gemmatimonadaceae bacterium]
MNAHRAIVIALVTTATAIGCRREESVAAPPGQKPLTVHTDYLEHLGLDATVNNKRVRVVSLYAEAPEYRPTGSPERDGFEGIASVDDAARAAVAYLRDYETSGDVRSRNQAVALLSFLSSMEKGDGEFVNFIDANGRQNLKAVSSRKSMSFWAARSVWALAEAEHVLGPTDSMQVKSFRPVLDRAVTRMKRDIDAGHLIGGSATATAEGLLGLLALQRADPSPSLAALAGRAAILLVSMSDKPWHAWGDRSTQALVTAAVVLNRPEFTKAAKQEADTLWSKFLLAGQVPAEISADGTAKWFPQIAYGIGPIVEGYLALADATGDRRYAIFAGLTASWFVGANAAHVEMYDEKSGRTFDGIDGPSPVKVNRNAGAESTIESLLALQSVASSPEASEYLHYKPVGDASLSLSAVPDRREFSGPGGERIILRRGASGIEIEKSHGSATPITLTYWPAANPEETRLANLLADQWNRENPGVQVRVQPLPAGRSSEEVLLAAIVAKATPDVSSNVSSALLARLVRAGGVVRLDNRVATSARLRERETPAMLASLRLSDGGIYAYPWKTNPEMLMYNIDLFKAAHLAPPRTQSELLNVWRKLARDTDGDGRNDRWAMWATLKTTWFERFYDFYPLYLASSGGRTLVTNGKVVFDNQAAVDALDLLRRGFANGSLPRSNFAIGRDPFADGTVAMKIIGPWFLKELNRIKIAGLHYDVVPVPGGDDTKAADQFAFADLRSIAVFSTTRHPDEAARFVAYLTSPAADKMLIEEASQLPYRRGLSSDSRFSRSIAEWPTLARYATYVERGRDIDVDPDIVEIFDIISEAYESASIYGTVPVREAVAKAAAEARNIIRAR